MPALIFTRNENYFC